MLRRTTTTTLTALALAAGGIALAPSTVSAAPPIIVSADVGMQVTGFDVRAVDRLETGAELEFTLWGTPGSQASLRIDGAQRRVPLSETAPGVYRGTYVVGARDRIAAEARVTAELRRGDLISTALLGESLERGGPQAAWRQPPVAWGSPHISSVQVSDAGSTRHNQVMRFTVYGTPGARATVRLEGNYPRLLALDEVRPGEYSTVYTLRPGVVLSTDRPLVAQLTIGDRVATQSLDRPYENVNLAARHFSCTSCGIVEAVNRIDHRWRTEYEVVVRTNDGERRVVAYDALPAVRVGDSVRVIGNSVEPQRG